MNKQQAQRLIDAVNWAVKDHNRWHADEERQEGSLGWSQSTYASGRATEETAVAPWYGEPKSVTLLCASGCCLAGNITVAHGDRLALVTVDARPEQPRQYTDYVLTEAGELRAIHDRALELVGLTTDEVSSSHGTFIGTLFGGGNDIGDVVLLATRILEENGYALTLDEEPFIEEVES